MVRFLILGFISLFLVGACGPTDFAKETKQQLDRQNSQRTANIARNNGIWAQRKAYIVSGKRYEVGISPDRRYALVAPVGQDSFALGEVEDAARAATGCSAKGDSFLYLLGANQGSRIPISALKNVSGRTRVELA